MFPLMATAPFNGQAQLQAFLKLDVRRQLAAPPHVVETAFALPFAG
jgi:hypothetical protein